MRSIISVILVLSITNIYSQQLLTPRDEGSTIHFTIRNFGIKTGGDLKGLKGTIQFNSKNIPSTAIDVTVNAASIDTDNGRRDSHLRSDDFFAVAKYPVIRIASTSIQSTTDAATWLFSGKLTIKGVTKPISFPFTVKPSDGGYLFAGEFRINRRDFTVGGNSATMSDDVDVSLSVFAK